MSEKIVVELTTLGEAIKIKVRRSLKASNIGIRIKGEQVELVLPCGTSEETGYKFLESKEKWIRAQLKDRKESPGKYGVIHREYSILDNEYKLNHINTKTDTSVSIQGEYIVARVPKDDLFTALTNLFQEIALLEANALIKDLVKQHKLKYKKIILTELDNQWVGNSTPNKLIFNWRLIFAPIPVFHYVITYELCSFKEKRDSAAFWKLVSKISPDYQISQFWLTKYAQKLSRYLALNS